MQETNNLVAGSIWRPRYQLAESAEGMNMDMDMGTGVQSTQAEAVQLPAEDTTGKLRPNATPVGWFSDRRRIPAHSGIEVTRFHVWQDLAAGVDRDLAPLHATITFELSNEWYSSLSKPNGVIRIENMKDEDVIEAGLMIHQANFGLESSQLVLERQLQFVMSPTPLYR